MSQRHLIQVMRSEVKANPDTKDKKLRELVVAKPSISVNNLPSASAFNRAKYQSITSIIYLHLLVHFVTPQLQSRLKIIREEEQYYNLNWGRLEKFLQDFKEENPDSHTDVKKDFSNRFVGCFIGFGASKFALEATGLGFFALDACHSYHRIAKGLRLHILAARTGENTVLILAICLHAKESNESYLYFARQCNAFGLQEFFEQKQEEFEKYKQKMVVYVDGFKGCEHFTDYYEQWHVARCARHLANRSIQLLFLFCTFFNNNLLCLFSIIVLCIIIAVIYCFYLVWLLLNMRSARHNLRERKRVTRDSTINASFQDSQIFALCYPVYEFKAATVFARFQATWLHAADYMKVHITNEKWSLAAMTKLNVCTFGHITSNTVEGTNGTVGYDTALYMEFLYICWAFI